MFLCAEVTGQCQENIEVNKTLFPTKNFTVQLGRHKFNSTANYNTIYSKSTEIF